VFLSFRAGKGTNDGEEARVCSEQGDIEKEDANGARFRGVDVKQNQKPSNIGEYCSNADRGEVVFESHGSIVS